jgi:multisubunit Na+/H+ antiporter MnhG subunit
MKILGLIMAVLGWFIAVLSVKVPGATGEILVALFGFLFALVGVIGVLNGAHLKNAIWKG